MKKISLLLISICLISHVFAQNKTISLEDIWIKRVFQPESMESVIPMNDGEHYCVFENDSIFNLYEYKTANKTGEIVLASRFIPEGESEAISVDDFTFSNDENKILISTNTQYIYRHSSISEYYIWDRLTSKLIKLSSGANQRLAEFSPDGNKVAFVRENNLFIKDLVSGKESQLTTDGLLNNIINGTTDWVYEEEFGFTKAFFWSPDGNKIAYYRFDESKVKQFDMVLYDSLYPTTYQYKYPKAGEDNSLVSIHVYDLASGITKLMDVGSEKDQYIPRIQWTQDANLLSIQRMNRLQNQLEILISDASNGTSKVIYKENNKCYIEISDNLSFLKDKKHFLFTSDQDGYNHIYLYTMEGALVKQITLGKWEVLNIEGVDEKKKLVYYMSNEESPINTALYVVKLDGTGKKKLSIKEGANRVLFSKTFTYFMNEWSDANTPSMASIHKADGSLIKTLVENNNLKTRIKEYNFSPIEFFSFKNSVGIELNGWMIKPANFDSSKKYPVLMYVYGGPGAQTVLNSWGYSNTLWYQMLAQKGYMIVSVDNRGTGGRGDAFKKATYGQLGNLETQDQIDAAKYLGSLSYVDNTRIGIWGWSYGGYMTALCLTKGADYFKTGISVAPVTNWRYYDNIYTERYMGLPQDNAIGYDDNSPVNHVKKLKANFLLVHGTADDNVHFQNSMMLVNSLVNANKQFEQFFYPNKNHGIYGGVTRYHLYNKMTNFIMDNL